jgi:hypothetical protein
LFAATHLREEPELEVRGSALPGEWDNPGREGPFKMTKETDNYLQKKTPVRTAVKTLTDKWYVSLLGLFSLGWFLLRVLPKPSRASYPCQKAAAPMAAGFVVWLAGLAASGALFRKARGLSQHRRSRAAGVIMALAIVAVATWSVVNSPSALRAFQKSDVPYKLSDGPLSPVGTGKGINPGRVVWVHDPKAVSWNLTGNWWEDAYNNQAAIDGMVSNSVRWLTNEKSDARAWRALFRYFNQTHGRGNVGYRPGEKIAIKVNMNNTTDHGVSNRLNTSPHVVFSIVKQLVETAGVKPSAITVLDPSRFIPQYLYDKCHSRFPDVVFVDHVGGDGRTKAEYKADALPFSIPSKNATGIATAAVEATYLIDAAILKGHVGQGVTLCAKNLFGLTSIDPNWRKNAHDYFGPKKDGSPSYMTFVDFLGHKDLGGKTMLFVIDSLFANDLVDDPPHLKWKMAPFNDSMPASLFVSQDGVAIDSVGLDFLRSEWPNLVDLSYSDNYMREAALADNPPSKTVYDPERDGTKCTSMGVHEHWNNPIDKKYSRNLGKATGIELYTGPK